MGAFGSCLGVGRPMRPGANPRLLGSNLVGVDSSAFGPPGGSSRAGMMRGPPTAMSRQAYLPNAGVDKNGQPISKLLRQSSALSGEQQQLPRFQPHQSPSQTVPKLVDIDDNPQSPLDKPTMQNSQLICNNRKQQQNSQPSSAESSLTALFMQHIRQTPNDVKALIALYDYETRTAEDLRFRKGDHLVTTVSLMSGDWWLAQSKSTGKIGYVPSNYVAELKTLGAEPWYFGKIGRTEAEMRLRQPENMEGAFIIRDSETAANQYSLSLKHTSPDGNDVKHYRIKQFEAGGFYIGRKIVFSTIHDLVQHYSKSADGLCTYLREPCISHVDKPTTSGLSHDTCDKYEIDRSTLTLLQELGRGQFGQVFEGLYNETTRVAIKTLRNSSMEPQDFLAEAQIMKKMHHKNLVQLFAVCTKEEPVYIVTELMSKGALISYLQTEEGKSLPLNIYIDMATQIADGMAYLEKNKYVHRDLAARNILVGENNVCKIADFGLARFMKETEYEARVGAKFPIKWTAPEAANFSKFSTKSDVWSFGIVLYEIITKGGTPYPEMTNADVVSKIDRGYRMQKPPNCEDKYYQIMVKCWHSKPECRPTFDNLHFEFEHYFMPDEQYKDAEGFLNSNKN